MIMAFGIIPPYLNDLKPSEAELQVERATLQKQSNAALAKSSASVTVQASEFISQCKATLKNSRRHVPIHLTWL